MATETNGTHHTDEIKRVLILGAIYPATAIIRELAKTSQFSIHVAHPREPSSKSKNVKYHQCQTAAESLRPVISEIKPDVIISTVSGNSFELQKSIIDLAIETGVPRFIPFEFGLDSLNPQVAERLPPNKERARVIEYLRQQSSTISWVAIATGTDLSRALLSATTLGIDIKWESATLHGEASTKFPASSSAWIGRVVLAVLQHWDRVENDYIYAAGLTTSSSAIVSALETATGRQFVTSRTDVEDAVREAETRIERGFPDAGMFLMGRSVLYDENTRLVRPFEDEDAKDKLGLQAEKLEDIIEWVLHEMKHHEKGGCGCD